MLTSNFVTSASSACQNLNITVTYTGNGSNTANYTWDFNGATIVSGSGKGPYTIKWSTTGTKNVSLSLSENGCTSNTTNLNISVSQNGWTGSIDNDWNKPGNWCTNIVPNIGTNVLIPSGVNNMPVVNSAANCKTLTIANSATLIIITGGKLTIDSTYTRNGQLEHTGGYLILNFPQLLAADTHHVLTLNGVGVYALNGNMQINNLITIGTGTTLNDGGNIIKITKDIINNGTHTGTGKMVFSNATSQTISGTGNTYKNIELTSSSTLRTANNMTVLGSIGLNPGSISYQGFNFTIGSISSTDSNKVYGNGLLVNSSNIGTLTILGDTGAARLIGLRVQSKAAVIINRSKGVKLGGGMVLGALLNLTLGTLDMNGNSLSVGTVSTSTGGITATSGSITNSGSTGSFSVSGNGAASAITNLKLGSQYKVNVSLPSGVTLGQGCNISSLFAISSGFVNLNGYTVTLGGNATISEAAGQTFRGNSGSVQISKTYSAPLSNTSPGGLGLTLSTNNNPGTVTISRSHGVYTNGSGSSIKRNFQVTASNTSGLRATNLLVNYDSTELNGSSRNYLRLNSSINSGSTWATIAPVIRTYANTPTGYAGSNSSTMSLSSTTLYTLSDSLNSPLRVLQNIDPVAESMVNSKVWPIPFNNYLNIEVDEISNITIYDMEGKLVVSSKANGFSTINTELLPLGVYTLRIDSNGGSSVHKIVKQ